MSHAPDPVHQFEISRLIRIFVRGIDFSFTNVSFFMVVTVVLSSVFLFVSSSRRGLIPTRIQSISEIAYEFVASTLRKSSGEQGIQFFSLVFSLFIFILVANFIGLFPYFYTITSQIMITFSLAMLVIVTVVGYGLYKNGSRFFKLFVPSGVPVMVLPLVVMIEVISFLSRPISLSLRLFANMLAGHITLKVFSGFIVSMAGTGFLGVCCSIFPLAMTVAITALEVLVAFLQAYVFTVLTCMYLNDAVHQGH